MGINENDKENKSFREKERIGIKVTMAYYHISSQMVHMEENDTTILSRMWRNQNITWWWLRVYVSKTF